MGPAVRKRHVRRANSLVFTAGIGDESHGLLGEITRRPVSAGSARWVHRSVGPSSAHHPSTNRRRIWRNVRGLPRRRRPGPRWSATPRSSCCRSERATSRLTPTACPRSPPLGSLTARQRLADDCITWPSSHRSSASHLHFRRDRTGSQLQRRSLRRLGGWGFGAVGAVPRFR